MVQTEFLQAGRVDDVAVVAEVVELRVRGRVTACAERARNLGYARGSVRYDTVDDGRLSHPGLSDQYTHVRVQVRLEGREIAFRAEGDDAIAEAAIEIECRRSCF